MMKRNGSENRIPEAERREMHASLTRRSIYDDYAMRHAERTMALILEQYLMSAGKSAASEWLGRVFSPEAEERGVRKLTGQPAGSRKTGDRGHGADGSGGTDETPALRMASPEMRVSLDQLARLMNTALGDVAELIENEDDALSERQDFDEAMLMLLGNLSGRAFVRDVSDEFLRYLADLKSDFPEES